MAILTLVTTRALKIQEVLTQEGYSHTEVCQWISCRVEIIFESLVAPIVDSYSSFFGNWFFTYKLVQFTEATSVQRYLLIDQGEPKLSGFPLEKKLTIRLTGLGQ